MKALQVAKKRMFKEVGLEDQIAALLDYGRPSIFCYDDLTWSCQVELNTDQIVSGAKVKSGYKHPTCGSAVEACLSKCRQLNNK